MAAYKDLIGQKITKVTSNPGEPKTGQMWYNSTDGKLKGLGIVSAWSSAAPLTDARETQGFGSQTSGLVAGGSGPFGPPFTAVELYDGTGWSTGTSLPADRNQFGPAVSSPQTAGLIFGGNSPPGSATNTSLEWDGSSWTSGGNYPATLARLAGAGTQTSALGAGGKYPHSNVAAIYDGSSWTAISNIGTARYALGGAGASSTSAVIFGGSNQSYPSYNSVNNTEEWNGSSWSEENNLSTARSYIAGCGTQTAALTGAGITNPSSTLSGAIAEAYDGTSWTSAPNPAQARHTYGMGGNSSNAFMAGGATPTKVSSTEELTTSTNTITAAAWASGGNLNTGRNAGAGFGIQTAAVMTTGNEPGETNKTEHYDGTSWTNATNYPISKRFTAASGTLTSGLVAGGSPAVATVNKYDGTNWTAANSLPTSTDGGVMFGTQTASVYSVGRNPSATTNTYEFDGTNWTAGGAAGTARYFLASSGTLTAGLMFGGQAPGPSIKSETEEYDGTSWSESGDLGTARYGVGGSSAGTQTDTIAFAGNNPAVVLTEGYDGTSWSTRPNMATARRFISGAGTATLGIGFGGNPPNNSTEEFTGETETANVADFTTS